MVLYPSFFAPISPSRVLISIFTSQTKGPYETSHSQAVATPLRTTVSGSYMVAQLMWRREAKTKSYLFPFIQKTNHKRLSCVLIDLISFQSDKPIESSHKYLHLSSEEPQHDITLASCNDGATHDSLVHAPPPTSCGDVAAKKKP